MSLDQTPDPCPLCGAKLPPGELCRARFELCLTRDFEHPSSYGSVHHLIVACYMLQHNEYSHEAWLETREMLVQALDHGKQSAWLRMASRRRLANSNRKWKITRGAKLPGIDALVWTRTIADVRLETADSYCADARIWAEGVLADTESILEIG